MRLLPIFFAAAAGPSFAGMTGIVDIEVCT